MALACRRARDITLAKSGRAGHAMQSCAGKRSLTTETAAAVVLEVTDPRELVAGDALRVVNEARAVAHRHRNAAQVQHFLALSQRRFAFGNGTITFSTQTFSHFLNTDSHSWVRDNRYGLQGQHFLTLSPYRFAFMVRDNHFLNSDSVYLTE